jgi:hypothetical protein
MPTTTGQGVATLPLMRAAARLQWGYQKTLNAVLRGDLVGEQDHRGRWQVDTASIETLLSQRPAAGVRAAPR